MSTEKEATSGQGREMVTFSSKIDADLHRRARIAAATRGINLQVIWNEAVRDWLDRNDSKS